VLTFIIPESPRYLYAKKKFNALRKTLQTFSQINGVEMGHYKIDEEIDLNARRSQRGSKEAAALMEENPNDIVEPEEQFSVLKQLKDKTTLINLWVILLCFCSVSFNYYMIAFYLKYVGGNIFINSISSVTSECIGNFAASIIQKYFGTKKSFIICFALSVIFAIPLLFVHEEFLIAA